MRRAFAVFIAVHGVLAGAGMWHYGHTATERIGFGIESALLLIAAALWWKK